MPYRRATADRHAVGHKLRGALRGLWSAVLPGRRVGSTSIPRVILLFFPALLHSRGRLSDHVVRVTRGGARHTRSAFADPHRLATYPQDEMVRLPAQGLAVARARCVCGTVGPGVRLL